MHIPLTAKVEGDRLVISIGVETLAWASDPENGGTLEGVKVDASHHHEFAKDVASEMMREDEIGQFPLSEFLDEMMGKAADSGSGALIWEKK